jgi:SAM-dependent methyltransferase
VAHLAYQAWIRARHLDLVAESYMHTHSGGPDLARVLRTLRIPKGSRVLDLGSGKGGACFTLARFPFAEVVGLEVSEHLIRIAEANASRLHVSTVRFVCGDAATFTALDLFTHLYMFNPFSEIIVGKVMENVRLSLERRPRDLTLVYKYPGTPAIVDQSIFTERRVMTRPNTHPFHIFEHSHRERHGAFGAPRPRQRRAETV